VCSVCAEETCQHDVRRAFGQHGEMGRESGCRGIDILYGDSCVVFEVRAGAAGAGHAANGLQRPEESPSLLFQVRILHTPRSSEWSCLTRRRRRGRGLSTSRVYQQTYRCASTVLPSAAPSLSLIRVPGASARSVGTSGCPRVYLHLLVLDEGILQPLLVQGTL
jgi:hypothetical protein